MSYGGELTFTLRHSPVTRLPTNDRNDRKGGAFVQMKVTTKFYHYYRMILIWINLKGAFNKILYLQSSFEILLLLHKVSISMASYKKSIRYLLCNSRNFLNDDIITKRKKHSFYYRILHSFLLFYLWDRLL